METLLGLMSKYSMDGVGSVEIVAEEGGQED